MISFRGNTHTRPITPQWQTRLKFHSMNRLKLFFAWILFGALMLVGFVVGLMFMVLGWVLFPLLRYSFKKRTYRMDDGYPPQGRYAQPPRSGKMDVIEGDYEVKERSSPH